MPDEVKELTIEATAELDVQDLRRKLLESKLEDGENAAPSEEQKKAEAVGGGKEEETAADEVVIMKMVQKSGVTVDKVPEAEVEKKSDEK